MKEAKRNRAAEAAKVGLVQRAFELTIESDSLIDDAATYLSARDGRRVAKVRALEWLIREGAKKIPK